MIWKQIEAPVFIDFMSYHSSHKNRIKNKRDDDMEAQIILFRPAIDFVVFGRMASLDINCIKCGIVGWYFASISLLSMDQLQVMHLRCKDSLN